MTATASLISGRNLQIIACAGSEKAKIARRESSPSSPRRNLAPNVPTPELLQSRLHRVRA
jgi:hypothetical protein